MVYNKCFNDYIEFVMSSSSVVGINIFWGNLCTFVSSPGDQMVYMTSDFFAHLGQMGFLFDRYEYVYDNQKFLVDFIDNN